MANLSPEIIEQILIRLKVKDLIRFKCVSKSWLALISDPSFIKAHIKHSYERDRNLGIEDRRIVVSELRGFIRYDTFDIDNGLYGTYKIHMLGSSDGLVCVSPFGNQVVILNPSTREVSRLTTPRIPEPGHLCFGFGYDSSTKDYKVVLGSMIRKKLTSFQVLSLRSNTWRVIGGIEYIFRTRVGILCNGSLHWLAYRISSEMKYVIISFSLSEEKFVEIPQPDNVSYQSRLAKQPFMRLGSIEDCLCVFRYENLPNDIWILKGYNGKQSWEIFGPERVMKRVVVHTIKHMRCYVPNKRNFCFEPYCSPGGLFLGNAIFVESLLSPHFHRRPRRKRQAANTMTSPRVKLINDDGSISGAGAQSLMP